VLRRYSHHIRELFKVCSPQTRWNGKFF